MTNTLTWAGEAGLVLQVLDLRRLHHDGAFRLAGWVTAPGTSNQPETYDYWVDIPVGQLMNIVVDCPDADISARFWAAVLGWERVQETAEAVDIADASDSRRRLVFQQIADYRPPGWPDQGPPQQLHLDVRVDDLETADQRVRALGAAPLGERVVLEDETYRVYADPAGHPFCLVQLETT